MADKNDRRYSKKPFFRCYRELYENPNYPLLTAWDTKLLFDLGYQLRYSKDGEPRNNGDLCAAFSVLKPLGWSCKSTLARSLERLQKRGFIVMTQRGEGRSPNLYAVTWHAISDMERKPLIRATNVASREFTKLRE